MNRESRDTSSVLSEFWHDWGEGRLISSGDSMAYESEIQGCPALYRRYSGNSIICSMI